LEAAKKTRGQKSLGMTMNLFTSKTGFISEEFLGNKKKKKKDKKKKSCF